MTRKLPNDPVLAVRGGRCDPNSSSLLDRVITVNRQPIRPRLTLRANHRFSGDTRFSLLANATYQLKDDITLFGGEIDNLNGEVGDPKLIADVNLSLDKGPMSFFWGIDYVGKSSNAKQFIEDNGALCNVTTNGVATYGDYCYK